MKRIAIISLVMTGGCLNGCTFSGKFNNPQEALGLANYKHPPGLEFKKSILGEGFTVTSEGEASCEQLDYVPVDKSVHIKGLRISSNPTALVKQLGDNAVGIKDQYAIYAATHAHESDNQTQEVLAGIQAGADIAKAFAPILAAAGGSAGGIPGTVKSGMLSGLLGGGIDPVMVKGLMSTLIGMQGKPTP